MRHYCQVFLAKLDDHEAHGACNVLLQAAIIQIRATAYLQRQVGRPVGDVEISEEIRRLADLCDGLAGPECGAAQRLRYRLSVLSEDQAQWVRGTLNDSGYSVANDSSLLNRRLMAMPSGTR
jgi:hypothetical protein